MADFDSSLNIKTANDGDVKVSLVDKTTPSNALAIDSAGNISTTANGFDGTNFVPLPIDAVSGGLKVDIVDASGIVVDVNLSEANDSVLIYGKDPGTGTQSAIFSDSAGNLSVIVTNPVEIKTTLGPIFVTETNLSANSLANPLYVSDISAGAAVSTPIHNFTTLFSVGAGLSQIAAYSVTLTKTLNLKRVRATSSGQIKMEVQVNNVVVAVGFNSAANPNVDYSFENILEVASGGTVKVVIFNREAVAADAYVEVIGSEF